MVLSNVAEREIVAEYVSRAWDSIENLLDSYELWSEPLTKEVKGRIQAETFYYLWEEFYDVYNRYRGTMDNEKLKEKFKEKKNFTSSEIVECYSDEVNTLAEYAPIEENYHDEDLEEHCSTVDSAYSFVCEQLNEMLTSFAYASGELEDLREEIEEYKEEESTYSSVWYLENLHIFFMQTFDIEEKDGEDEEYDYDEF